MALSFRTVWPAFVFIPLVLLHLIVAPYTKVEESFNTQAIHDIIYHQIPRGNATQYFEATYDHFLFPGSVPRTFVGALITGGIASPLVRFFEDGENVQILVRAIIGIYNALALTAFKSAVDTAYGKTAGIWYVLLQASQFHIIFYASRPLPNMFAFGITTLALRSYLLGRSTNLKATSLAHYRLTLYLLTLSGIIFRAEIAAYLLTTTLYLLLTHGPRPILLRTIISAGILGSLLGLALTVTIDSYFWQSFPLWPEWSSFYYNTIQGKSSEWGTEPVYFYFINALLKLLFNPLSSVLLIPLTHFVPALRRRSFDLLVPGHAFVALYSILPHKEWRFIVYYVPPLTAVAAGGASWIWIRRSKSIVHRLLSLALVGSVLASFLASTAMLAVSSLNYPGGVALSRLHALAASDPTISSQFTIRVHLDNLSCQSGVTRFLQDRGGIYNHANITLPLSSTSLPLASSTSTTTPRWIYDKTESSTTLLTPEFWLPFDYALAEKVERVIGKWEVLETVDGFAGVRVLRPGMEAEGVRCKEGKGWCALWKKGNEVGRRVAGGWWVEVRMDGRVRVLRQVRD